MKRRFDMKTTSEREQTYFILLRSMFLGPLSGLLHEQLFVVFEL